MLAAEEKRTSFLVCVWIASDWGMRWRVHIDVDEGSEIVTNENWS